MQEGSANEIEKALFSSISKGPIAELGFNLADITLDAIFDSKVLEAVPLIGTIYKVARGCVTIRDHLFARKPLAFLSEASKASTEQHEQFSAMLDEEKFRTRFGETVLLILEKLDDMAKPPIVGRIIRAAIEGQVHVEDALRYAAAVNGISVEGMRSFAGLVLDPEHGRDRISVEDGISEVLPYGFVIPMLIPEKEVSSEFYDGVEEARIDYEVTFDGKEFAKLTFPIETLNL